MIGKLALHNAKRSIKDYTIYLLSLTIIFSLLCTFNMMIFSKDILEHCENMSKMVYVINVVSVIIVLVSAWLVHYMNNFMLQRRSREFGIYENLQVKGELSYPIYRSGIKTIYNLLPYTFCRYDFKDDTVMKYSDYAANTKKKTTVDDYNNLNNYNKPYPIKSSTGTSYNILEDEINVKGELLTKSRSDFAVFAFSLFYLGLVFLCIAATILAVQQLSDCRYKFRYKILRNLGMEEWKIDQYILKQCLFYFGFPILLPIPISILITYCIAPIIESTITRSILPATLMTSIGLFLLIYFLYFIATFVSYRKNVQE